MFPQSNTYVTAKLLRIIRIQLLEAIINGNEDKAYGLTRMMVEYSLSYLWDNHNRVIPKF